jgi:hypothetical protein
MKRLFETRRGPAFERVSHIPGESAQFPPQAPQRSSKRVSRNSRSMFDAMPQGPLQPSRFQSPIEKQRYTLLLALFTCGAMIFTVFFAFNSSLIKPLSTRLIFDTPATSVLMLNIASQVTIFCLAELTICVFEAIRWAFAASARGVQGYTFLSLSRATNIIGVLALLAVGSTAKQPLSGSHRFWGSQRYNSPITGKWFTI